MDTADRAEPAVAQLKKGQLQDKIAALKEQMQQLKEIETLARTKTYATHSSWPNSPAGIDGTR